MVKNAKAKGTKFEHDCIKWLKDHGFPIVVRAAGSLGTFDLLAIHETGYAWAVSCKYLKKYSSRKQENEMCDIASQAFNCKPVLMFREKPRGKIVPKVLFYLQSTARGSTDR